MPPASDHAQELHADHSLPPALVAGKRFEHESNLDGKTLASRVSSQWKSTNGSRSGRSALFPRRERNIILLRRAAARAPIAPERALTRLEGGPGIRAKDDREMENAPEWILCCLISNDFNNILVLIFILDGPPTVSFVPLQVRMMHAGLTRHASGECSGRFAYHIAGKSSGLTPSLLRCYGHESAAKSARTKKIRVFKPAGTLRRPEGGAFAQGYDSQWVLPSFPLRRATPADINRFRYIRTSRKLKCRSG
jgi:hypothetical protein